MEDNQESVSPRTEDRKLTKLQVRMSEPNMTNVGYTHELRQSPTFRHDNTGYPKEQRMAQLNRIY